MELVLNPTLRITPVDEQGPAYAVSAAVRGRGLQGGVISRARHQPLFDVLEQLLGRAGGQGSHIALSDAQERALRRMGIFIPPSQVPRPVRFLHRPGRFATRPSRRSAAAATLRVNPAAQLEGSAPGGGQDPELAERLSSPYVLAWVPEPRTQALVPVHLEPRQAELLSQLSQGRQALPGRRPSALVSALEGAGLLLPPTDARQVSAGPTEQERQSFRRSGYAILDAFFSRPFCLSLSTYFQALRAQGFLLAGDVQVPSRNVLSNEAVSVFLHRQLSPFVSALVGRQVKPSYCYVAEYMPGAVLRRHVDRPQCEFTISLLVDFRPRPAGKCAWPLWLSPTGKDRLGVRLGIGDAVLYKGREIAHWRNALAPDKRSISLFFHFVSESFDGALT